MSTPKTKKVYTLFTLLTSYAKNPKLGGYMDICYQCKGATVIPTVFGGKKIGCPSCRDPKTGISTGYIWDPIRNCPVCKGGGSFKGMGGMQSVLCSYCSGTGRVNESTIKADAEQNNLESSQNSQTKTTVDKSTSNSSKRERVNLRKESAVGISTENI